MQQIYIREFVRKPGEEPLVNYGSLSRQYYYLDRDMHAHLLLDWERSPSDEAYADLEQRFNMSVDEENFVENQVTNALRPFAEDVKECCSFEQRKALYYALGNGDTSLNPELFPKDSMARKAAEAYLNASNEIELKLRTLSDLSAKIHDRPHSSTELIEAAIRRKELKEKYGIDIETHNLSGERVADSIDISTDRTSSTLEGILRQAEQNGAPAPQDESQSHGAYNPTLANNSRTNITTHDADFSNQPPHPSSRNNGGNGNIA
jgi:hypothetical protein